jgi:hypothetical protein
MKLTNVIEGGLTGISTLALLQEALHKIDSRSPRPLSANTRMIRKLQKANGHPKKGNKYYIRLAQELLTNAAYFGLAGLGKKKNAVLRGGLLGTAAGLGSALMQNQDDGADTDITNGISKRERLKKNILTVSLYTAGGLLAGTIVKKLNKKKKKK